MNSIQSSQLFSMEKFQSCGLEISKNQIDSLNKRESVMVFFDRPYYSQPKFKVANSDENLHPLYEGQIIPGIGQRVRNELFAIISIEKRVKLSEEKIYCGSLGLSTLIDIFQDESGNFFLDDNLWTAWNNSQYSEERIKDFSFERFEIESGEIGGMEQYNLLGAQKKQERKQYFSDALAAAGVVGIEKKKAFAIAKANNVTVLVAVTKLAEMNISKRAALQVAKKGQAWGYAQAVLKTDPKMITRLFDNLVIACRIYSAL